MEKSQRDLIRISWRDPLGCMGDPFTSEVRVRFPWVWCVCSSANVSALSLQLPSCHLRPGPQATIYF